MAYRQKGAGLGGYTCTTGPKRGTQGEASGVQLGKYTTEQKQNRQRKNPSNGGTGNGFNK